jgi:hypothetical protein
VPDTQGERRQHRMERDRELVVKGSCDSCRVKGEMEMCTYSRICGQRFVAYQTGEVAIGRQESRVFC